MVYQLQVLAQKSTLRLGFPHRHRDSGNIAPYVDERFRLLRDEHLRNAARDNTNTLLVKTNDDNAGSGSVLLCFKG